MNEVVKKKYTVQLFGEPYTIISDEPEEDVLQAVDLFNQCMQILVEETGIKDIKKVALLSGLQLSQELIKLQRCRLALAEYTDRTSAITQLVDDSSLL